MLPGLCCRGHASQPCPPELQGAGVKSSASRSPPFGSRFVTQPAVACDPGHAGCLELLVHVRRPRHPLGIARARLPKRPAPHARRSSTSSAAARKWARGRLNRGSTSSNERAAEPPAPGGRRRRRRIRLRGGSWISGAAAAAEIGRRRQHEQQGRQPQGEWDQGQAIRRQKGAAQQPLTAKRSKCPVSPAACHTLLLARAACCEPCHPCLSGPCFSPLPTPSSALPKVHPLHHTPSSP